MQITCPVDGIYIFYIYTFLIKQTCIHIIFYILLSNGSAQSVDCCSLMDALLI